MRRALDDARTAALITRASELHVLAVGKASARMLAAFEAHAPRPWTTALAIAPQPPTATASPAVAGPVTWQISAHPVPDDRSVVAASLALAQARAVPPTGLLVVLLSGGSSALMAMPAAGLTLDDKQATVRRLLAHGAPIAALNAVRKHLSAVKGGRLAEACAGQVVTLALSDVPGDRLSVIGSGPTVPDDSTFADALAALARHGGVEAYAGAVVRHLEAGLRGEVPETLRRLPRAEARVIAANGDVVAAVAAEARRQGRHVEVIDGPTVGEAREVGARLVREAIARASARSAPGPWCLVAGGETTVEVRGTGRGGRNQECALAMACAIAAAGADIVAASLGTDGVDGPTDAAGAVVDRTTVTRARQAGLDPDAVLRANDSFTLFDRLGDLLRPGPSGTNLNDIQILLGD